MKCKCGTDTAWLIEAINQKHGDQAFRDAVNKANRCQACHYTVRRYNFEKGCLTACKEKDDEEFPEGMTAVEFYSPGDE